VTTFCLIHGSTQDSRGWNLLARELAAAGHEVVAPTLPTDEPGAGAVRCAQVVAESVPPSGRLVLVAHSAGGLILPVAATLMPTALMVFLAAAIPVPGMSFVDQLRPDPAYMLNRDWIGQNPSEDDKAALTFLFHDCSPEVAAWVLTTRLKWNPVTLYEEAFPLSDWPDVRSAYVLCRDDRTVRPEWSRRAARECLGVEAIEIPGGHCPHVARPSELASLLVSVS